MYIVVRDKYITTLIQYFQDILTSTSQFNIIGILLEHFKSWTSPNLLKEQEVILSGVSILYPIYSRDSIQTRT